MDIIVQVRHRVRIRILPTPLFMDLQSFWSWIWSRLLPANTACVRSFAYGTNGIPVPSEVLPLAVIGYHWFFWSWIFPVCSRRIQRAFGVLLMVPMAYQCRLKFCHWQLLATIGTNGMPMVTVGCHWVLPLVANLADNLEGRQNYQRTK